VEKTVVEEGVLKMEILHAHPIVKIALVVLVILIVAATWIILSVNEKDDNKKENKKENKK
jgi:biopolymer transport protein ExbD